MFNYKQGDTLPSDLLKEVKENKSIILNGKDSLLAQSNNTVFNINSELRTDLVNNQGYTWYS